MRKIVIFFFICLLGIAVSPPQISAAKKRIWKTKNGIAITTRPTFSPSLRRDKLALNVKFFNISLCNSITYELTYLSNGVEQGVFGSVFPKEGNVVSRQLLFGTCSHNVCTYHKNIKNMRLTITAKLNSGKTLISRYRIRI